MKIARSGMMKVLGKIAQDATSEEICSVLNSAGFSPLDALGPGRVGKAAEAWRLYRLGVVTELLSVFYELASLPHLELLASLVYDLSTAPPRRAWSSEHPLRVATVARLIATDGVEAMIGRGALRWSRRPTEEGLEGLWMGALLHDFGKLLLPVELNAKLGILDDTEQRQLQQHPASGHRALSQISWPWPEVLPIVLHHHEMWNGQGYPNGLIGDEIPWTAQLVAIANFCDSLLSPRAYRKPFTASQVVDIITTESGTRFNPVLVEATLEVWEHALTVWLR